MKNLLNIELSKLFGKVSTYVVLVINLGLIFIGLISGTKNTLAESILSSSGLIVFGAILICGITSDINNGTMKNIIGAGISRTTVFVSKIVTSFIAVFVLIVTNTIGEIIFYLISGKGITIGTSEVSAFLLVTFLLAIYTILFVGINFIVSGSFGSVLTILISVFFPMAGLLTLVDNSAIKLIFGSEPSNVTKQILQNGLSTQYFVQLLVATILFIGVGYISMQMFKKKEIK